MLREVEKWMGAVEERIGTLEERTVSHNTARELCAVRCDELRKNVEQLMSDRRRNAQRTLPLVGVSTEDALEAACVRVIHEIKARRQYRHRLWEGFPVDLLVALEETTERSIAVAQRFVPPLPELPGLAALQESLAEMDSLERKHA